MAELKTISGSKVLVQSRTREDFYRLYGSHPLAYQTLDKSLEYYITDNGYLSYKISGNRCLVLGDPVAKAEMNRQLLLGFVERFPNATFVQINQRTASSLESLGYKISSFGIETSLSLPFLMDGSHRADIRHLYNAGVKANIDVKEVDISSSNIPDQFKSNNSARRFKKPMHFLAHSEIDPNDNQVRLFVGQINNQVVGMSLLSPIYQDGKIISYVDLLPRRTISAPKGTRVFILIKTMQALHSEGIKSLNLGLSPFVKPNYEQIHWQNHGKRTESLFNLLYNTTGSFFFNFKGLAFHKSRFRGKELETFFASRSNFPMNDLLRIYKITTGGWLPPLF